MADSARELAGGLRLRVVRTEEGLPAVRPAWLAMQGDQIAADPDFFAAGLRGDPKILRPHLVLLEREGEPVAMLVARVEQLELAHKLGYRSIYRPRVRSITTVYGGVLGNPDDEIFRILLGELRRGLDEGEADVLIFRYLPLDSPYYRQAAREPPFFSRQHAGQPGVHWELELPGSLDDLLQRLSSRTRKRLKKLSRTLAGDFGEALEVRTFKASSEIDEFFGAIEAIAPKTYQHALGVAFGDTEAHRERTSLAMERGWFRGYVLYLGGEAAAFEHGELYRGRFRRGNPGFDPKFAAYGVGTFLLMQVIDDLCSESDVRVVDHGLGDADYKRRFGSRSWEEASVFVFARTLKGVRINLTRTAALAVIRLSKALAGRRGLLGAIKRRSRARLSGGAQR